MDRLVVRLDSFAAVQRPSNAFRAVASAAVEHSDLATGRERRRQRNERRLELAASRKLLKDDDNSLEQQGRKKKNDPTIANLAKMGMQWYTLRVFTNNEAASAEALLLTLQEEFPEANFEVWTPIIPTEAVVRGKSRFSMRAMLRGHVFLRCVLNAPVYRFVMNERSVFCFIGAFPYKMKGFDTKMMKGGYPDVRIPAPIPGYKIEALRAEAAAKERDFYILQREKNQALEENVFDNEEKNHDLDKVLGNREKILRVGDAVAMASGPYQNFEGKILEFLPAGKVKVIVPVFGTDTEIEVDLDDLVENEA